MPDSTDKYMPVLRWKRGEQAALQNLRPATKDILDPIFVLEEPSYDPVTPGGHDPSFDAQLAQNVATLVRYWPAHEASIDFQRVAPDARFGAGGVHYVTQFFDAARQENAPIRPVVWLDADADFRAAVSAVVAEDGRGATLRLSVFEYDQSTNADIDHLLADIGLTPADVDLVLDSAQTVLPTAVIATVIVAMMGAIQHLDEWATVTLAAGSFPESLTSVAIGAQIIPRNCLTLWTAIRASSPPRPPRLGDYAIIHPEPVEIAGYMNPSASVKYTVDDGWLILRGQGTRTRGSGGYAQFSTHAQHLVAHPLYCGSTFSWGDEQINNIAAGGSPGNLETWVRIGINHHIEFVVDRLASYSGP